MKYKRKKMWKSWILFGFIFAMFFLIPTGYAYLKTRDVKTEKDIITDEMKLKNIGYSLNDISIIIKNKNIKKYALKNEYDSELMDYVNTKGFDINNLSKYKEYKKNNIDASIEDTIKIVNLGLNIEYSDKLINIINHKYFINSRVNRYLEYTGKNNIAEIIKYVNCDRDREFYTKILQTNTEKGILMLVNKYYYLNDSFTGLDLVNIDMNLKYINQIINVFL